MIAGTSGSSRIFTGHRKDFIVMRKDTFEYTGQYNFTTEDGIAATYDFTGCIGTMQIKKNKTDTAVVRSVGVTFDLYDYTLSVNADDMDMPAGRYHYDLQIYDTDSKMVTKLYGNFTVLQDVTDMTQPHEEEIYLYLNTVIDSMKMQSLKMEFLFESEIDTSEGIRDNKGNLIFNEINYYVQPVSRYSLVMSTEIAYALTTVWAKYNNTLGSEISYMVELVEADAVGFMTSEVSYSIIVN